jgi:aspartate carbamoyltransferase catalytic subunit
LVVGATVTQTASLDALSIMKQVPSLINALSVVLIGDLMHNRCLNRIPKTLTTRKQRNSRQIIRIQKDLPIQQQALAIRLRRMIEDSSAVAANGL